MYALVMAEAMETVFSRSSTMRILLLRNQPGFSDGKPALAAMCLKLMVGHHETLRRRKKQSKFVPSARCILHRLGVGFAIHEHFLHAPAARRGHHHLRSEFAGGIAGAFGDVIAFQSVFDVDGIG